MPSESLMDFILSCLEKTIFQCIRGMSFVCVGLCEIILAILKSEIDVI